MKCSTCGFLLTYEEILELIDECKICTKTGGRQVPGPSWKLSDTFDRELEQPRKKPRTATKKTRKPTQTLETIVEEELVRLHESPEPWIPETELPPFELWELGEEQLHTPPAPPQPDSRDTLPEDPIESRDPLPDNPCKDSTSPALDTLLAANEDTESRDPLPGILGENSASLALDTPLVADEDTGNRDPLPDIPMEVLERPQDNPAPSGSAPSAQDPLPGSGRQGYTLTPQPSILQQQGVSEEGTQEVMFTRTVNRPHDTLREVEFHRNLDTLNLPLPLIPISTPRPRSTSPPPPPEKYYTVGQLERFERGTLQVDSAPLLNWTEYHLQWTYFLQNDDKRVFREVKMGLLGMLRYARTQYDTVLCCRYLEQHVTRRHKRWMEALKTFIRDNFPSGNGERSAKRVLRANEKFLLAIKRGFMMEFEGLTSYNARIPIEKIASLTKTAGRMFSPGTLRGGIRPRA